MSFRRVCGVIAVVCAVLAAFGASVGGIGGVEFLAIGLGAAGIGLIVD